MGEKFWGDSEEAQTPPSKKKNRANESSLLIYPYIKTNMDLL
jgi:hypothetical protein